MKRLGEKIYSSPILLLALMAVSIYLIEFLVMVILIFVPHDSAVVHALFDSTLLILLLSPVLYLFLFRPLLSHITERRKMEEELLKSQKLESLSILAGGIAHDYNNLLTAIMANISFALQVEDSEMRVYKDKPMGAVLESLKDAEKATLRAKALTKQLITFSKGGAPIKEAVVDMDELIRESVGFALRGSNVRCEVSIPADAFSVDIDPGQISQVLQNIVINADQAMSKGGLITMAAENLTIVKEGPMPLKLGDYLMISIRDRGTGIYEDDLAKVFDPYFTTKESGSGLGLATAYSIIKKHEGHISVESETGVGTTFSIYLPASGKGAAKRAPEKGTRAQGAGRIGGKVLVMDDEKLVSDAACRILSQAGYEVASAKDGNEAIDKYLQAKLSGKPFDAVIMDLTIPGALGGKEAIKELFELDPGARAIVSSGYSEDPVMEDFESYGFKGAVVKPYNTMELKRVLRKVIEEAEAETMIAG